ncbi:MAG: hypothetical protein WC282_03980, partial [Bacilli bacterium]
MNNYSTYEQSSTTVEGKHFITSVFSYAALGFLITALIAFLASYLFTNVWMIQNNPDLYLGVMIGASIAQLVVMIWISFGVMRRGKNIAIPFLIYTIVMGVL